MDPKFLSLYREYARAIQALANATEQRRRARAALEAKRDLRTARRPVGSPKGFQISQAVAPPPRRSAPPRIMEIDMGPILGRVRFRSSPSPVSEQEDPAASFDVLQLHEKTSVELYAKTKVRYFRAKQAFFDYARTSLIAEHKARAKGLFQDAAKSQFFGFDDLAESQWKQAQHEIEELLWQVWKKYQSAPKPKSEEDKKLLLSGCALAQLVGIENTAVYQQAYPEIAALADVAAKSVAEFRKAVTEVRQRSAKALGDYRSAPEPKSPAAQTTLVLATAEAQLVLPPDDLTLKEMESEISRLLSQRGSVVSR